MRALSIQQAPKYTLAPFASGLALILVAPALFAASIYMFLGRIINVVQGDHHSLVRLSRLTKMFIAGDVMSFITQAIGAVIVAGQTKEDLSRGSNVITIGIVVQILFFGFFIITTVVFHWRTNRQPTDRSRNPGIPWKKHLWTLYLASAIMLVRCGYRFIEYRTQNQYLISHEWCMYAFDTTLMTLIMLLFFIVHPSEINALRHPRGGISMKCLAGRPVNPIDDHWRTLPPPMLSSKVMFEPGDKVTRMAVYPPRAGLYWK